MSLAESPKHAWETRACLARVAADLLSLIFFQSWTHNIQREKEFLRKLVKARVITDLTSGI